MSRLLIVTAVVFLAILVVNSKVLAKGTEGDYHLERVGYGPGSLKSYAATPKQIKELMKVDGLTNDEVKSHLQYFKMMVKEVLVFFRKYRLHTQRLPSSAPATANQDVLVMGGMRGLWVPNVHYQVSKQSTSQGSPQGPLQLFGTSRAVSTTGGDSGEDEDGKSESNSWNSHLGSGEETEQQD